MSLQELRTFVALASTGSFASASDLLARDPTSLSRRLQSLEAQVGVRLADRSTRSFTLTEAGRSFLDRVRPVLEELDAAQREASSFAIGTPRGRLRVALPGSFARRWLDPMIVAFLKAHPGITLDAHYSDAIVDIVGQGFDVAVRLAQLNDSRLIARKVASRRRLVCASPAYLAAHGAVQVPGDVTDHQCLCYTARKEPYRWTFQHQSGEAISVMANCYMLSDDADLLLLAARNGMGLFYTTDWHVGPYLAAGELVEILTDWPVVDGGAIYVVTPTALGMPNKTRAFSDWIAKGLATPPWAEA